MLAYESLKGKRKTLYDNLKDAIERGGDVNDVFQGQSAEDIKAVLGTYVSIDDDTSTTFLMLALEWN